MPNLQQLCRLLLHGSEDSLVPLTSCFPPSDLHSAQLQAPGLERTWKEAGLGIYSFGEMRKGGAMKMDSLADSETLRDLVDSSPL